MSFYHCYFVLPDVHKPLQFNSLRIPSASSLLSLLRPLTRALNKIDSNGNPSAMSSNMLQFQWFLANLPAKTFWMNVLGNIYLHTIHNISLKSKADSHISFVCPDPDVYRELQRAKLCNVILSSLQNMSHTFLLTESVFSLFQDTPITLFAV